MSLEKLRNEFLNPADEFSPMPFWFWNDALTEEELTRQIDDFHDHGVAGFVIHPRKGLPGTIPYLSDAYMHFVRHAVEEAAKRGMRVVLYDEGMYPSGAAHGMVAAENPDWASRCLWLEQPDADVPAGGDIVAACAAKLEDGVADVSVLTAQDGFFRLPRDGRRLLIFREGFSGGTIRGIHELEDDGEPFAPRSADLLNPEAVQCFIRLTHERYYSALKKHFGRTVIAMFTDEPDVTGRNARRGAIAWTQGFLAEFGDAADLPHLLLGVDEYAATVRRRYRQAVNARMLRTYYQPLADWCEAHNIALTGHPAKGWDIGLLAPFQLPGQDVVWRYVEPGRSITGEESVLGKCAADSARHRGRRRNANECFGCCGPKISQWAMTPGDMKWYMDYLFVRGVNLLYPHAFYYSVRDGRGDERPPDVGPNNTFWPEYKRIATYMRRLSWLMTDSVNQARVAVLCEGDRMPWRCCMPLYENQIEFNYLETDLLPECRVEDGALCIRDQRYTHVVSDNIPLDEAGAVVLAAFQAQGGTVLRGDQAAECPRGVTTVRPTPDLRVSHVVKEGKHFFLLTNEGDGIIMEPVHLPVKGRAQRWDPWTGECSEDAIWWWDGYDVLLEPRQSTLIVIDPEEPAGNRPWRKETDLWPLIPQKWTLTRGDGATAELLPGEDGAFPGWETIPGWETWSGCIAYEADVNVFPLTPFIFLGTVHGFTRAWANGEYLGCCLWGIHKYRLPAGEVRLRVEVTNTPAGRMDGLSLPSGIIGVPRSENIKTD